MNNPSTLLAVARRTMAILASVWLCLAGVAEAKQHNDISFTPKITDVSVDDGEIVVSGEVKARIGNRTVTADFDDIKLSVDLAEDQTGAGDCPILEIELDPISVDIAGLSIETSRICARISDYDDVDDIGDVLCDFADELEDGATLEEILEGNALSEDELDQLKSTFSDLLEEAHAALAEATVVDIDTKKGRIAAEISLELEATELDLLGFDVEIDDCEDGPVTIDVSVKRGGQLGNAITRALRNGDIEEGSTLEEILDELND